MYHGILTDDEVLADIAEELTLVDISDESDKDFNDFYDEKSYSLLKNFFPEFLPKIEGVSYTQGPLKHGKIRWVVTVVHADKWINASRNTKRKPQRILFSGALQVQHSFSNVSHRKKFESPYLPRMTQSIKTLKYTLKKK